MRIVVLEDDPMQSEWIKMELTQAFDGADVVIIETEFDFRQKIPDLRAEPPDVVLLDVMVRWTNPGPNMRKPPQDVQDGGSFRAGLRCQDQLTEVLPQIPVILYSILDKADLEPELEEIRRKGGAVTYMRKDSDPKQLIEKIRNRIQKA